MKNLVNKMLVCGTHFDRKQIVAAAKAHDWALVDTSPSSNKRVALIFLDNPSDMFFNTEANHYQVHADRRDAYNDASDAFEFGLNEGEVATIGFCRTSELTLPTYKELNLEMIRSLPVATQTSRTNAIVSILPDVVIKEARTNPAKFGTPQTPHTLHVSYFTTARNKTLSIVQFEGTEVGIIYGDSKNPSFHCTNLHARQQLDAWAIRTFTSADADTGTSGESVVDFLPREMYDLIAGGEDVRVTL